MIQVNYKLKTKSLLVKKSLFQKPEDGIKENWAAPLQPPLYLSLGQSIRTYRIIFSQNSFFLC